MVLHEFSDYPLKDVRNFAAGGGHSLLWLKATTFLIHRGAYLRPEADTVACGRRPQGFMSQMSRLESGLLVTLFMNLPQLGPNQPCLCGWLFCVDDPNEI